MGPRFLTPPRGPGDWVRVWQCSWATGPQAPVAADLPLHQQGLVGRAGLVTCDLQPSTQGPEAVTQPSTSQLPTAAQLSEFLDPLGSHHHQQAMTSAGE